MNKRLMIPFTLVAVLTLLLAAVMIGCRAEKNPPDGTSLNASAVQTGDSAGVLDPDNTYDISGTDVTGENADPTEKDSGTEATEEPTISMGAVDGEGSVDLDDEPIAPNNPSTPTKPTTPNTPTIPNPPPVAPTEPEETQGQNKPTDPEIDVEALTYETFWALSEEKQRAVINAFSTPKDFTKWYKAMAAQYKAEHPDVEIGDGGIVDLLP